MLAAMLCVVSMTYAQSTSGSGGQASNQNKQSQVSGSAGQNRNSQAGQSGNQGGQKSATQPAGQTGQNGSTAAGSGQSTRPASGNAVSGNDGEKSSTRPGGATHENANDVGKYSEKEDSKSMLNSKEAIAARKKNLTEPDTTLKKGSGSAPKNMRNKTGKTGNYKNEETKHNTRQP